MEIAIISGKGGTGKSSISAAFATLSERVVLADCDVDAANMHILFQPVVDEEVAFIGNQKAVIDPERCTNCGLCLDYCRFDAIAQINHKVVIDDVACDGCHLCYRICPFGAIDMENSDKSRLYTGSFRNGRMVSGRLAPGEENSGKLVNLVREKARQQSREYQHPIIILDGPPGIGCPVISTITGSDHVVIVTEPSLSGYSDLKRTLDITTKFQLHTWVIINKYDLNPEMSETILSFCHQTGITVAGMLPFDPIVVEAMVNCRSITEWDSGSSLASDIHKAFRQIING
ncbi:MAG: ATP-binding protein [Bacteroidales bacterium]|nr:ATP-binding protein [Bacteroidales bacterium]